MNVTQAKKLAVGDRVLFYLSGKGRLEGILEELSPSTKHARITYFYYGYKQNTWFTVEVLEERLAPLPCKTKGWFRR